MTETVVVNGREYALSNRVTPEMAKEMVETGCLFPDAHCPDHGPDYRWSVIFQQVTGAEWEELTEAEIVDRMEEKGYEHFLHTSEWDHWCENVHPEGRHYGAE
jgi:hypothetical protein